MENKNIWVEKSYIEQEKNCLNNENLGINGTTKKIPLKSINDGENGITKTKKNIDKKSRSVYYKNYRMINKDMLKKKAHEKYLKNKNRILKRVKSYYYQNREKKLLYAKKYNLINKNKHIEYRIKNKKRANERVRNLLKTNINFRISKSLRRRFSKVFSGILKSGSAVRDLGCSVEEFKKYIESKFQPGMTWENYGFYGWHLDHITPLDAFNLSDRNQFLVACHYTNYQPLWAQDNFIKNNKI